MKEENAALAARIKAAIERSGITKAELARRVGKTPQAVNGWLTTGTISKPLLSRVSQVLDEDLDYLLTGASTPPAPRMPKRATGKGHGETYKTLVVAESQPIAYQESELINAFRKMPAEARGALLVIALVLAGCTTTYVRPGATAEDFRTENAQCQVEANRVLAGSGGLAAISLAESTRHSCLEGKGWRPTS